MSTANRGALARRTAAPSPLPAGRRLSAAERRQELVRVAGSLMTRGGVDGVQFADVATAAGVTRPLVYRFFPNRQALILAVLEDFAGVVSERFARGFMRMVPGTNGGFTRVFVEALCDTIEELGAGPWHLLDSRGPDPEIARIGQEMMDELMAPWRMRLVEAIGVSERESMTLGRMIVAAGRAAIQLWCDGFLTREEVVRDTTRGVSALVDAFAVRPLAVPRGPARGERARAVAPRSSGGAARGSRSRGRRR